MKRIATAAILLGSLLSASALTAEYAVEVNNSAKLHLPDAPVVIPVADLKPDFNPLSATLFDGEKPIPCQVDDLDGDGNADEVAFVVNLRPRQRLRLTLTLSDSPAANSAEPRTWAGLQLYGRKKGVYVDINELGGLGSIDYYNMVYGHGVMLESELVGYRVYFNEKQTLDPYGKFTPRLELEACRFYPDDTQLAAGFGDDVLLVGSSCGIGAFKGWDGNRACHIAPVASRTQRIVARGPVRAIVETAVNGWEYDGETLDMTNRYTLYAGHRDLQVDTRFSRPLGSQRFATGVEHVMGNETVDYTDGRGIVASWGCHWPVNDTIKYAKETIGIATCIPADLIVDPAPRRTPGLSPADSADSGSNSASSDSSALSAAEAEAVGTTYDGKTVNDGDNLLYLISAPGRDKITYHTMFTSRKETFSDFDAESWFASLADWRRHLAATAALKVTVKPK